MLNEKAAYIIVKRNLPGSSIKKVIKYRELFIFQVFVDSGLGEESLDPFYSVNRKTKEFKEYSIMLDGDLGEVTKLFEEAEEV